MCLNQGVEPFQITVRVQVCSSSKYFSGSGLVRVHFSTIFEVQVWFRFIQVKYYWFRFGSGSLIKNLTVVTRFAQKQKRRNCWSCWWSPLLLLCVYQRHPDMEKYILTFVRGSGSVWVHLSTILRVQVSFRFTEVKFCWFRFGSGSPKWNGSFGFTVRVQVRFDTLV